MAIGANTYGSVDEVAALTGRYTESGAYDTTTQPTAAQVEKFLDRVSGLVNLILARQGFVIPVIQTDAKLVLDEFVVQEAVQLAHGANGSGLFAPDSEALTNRTPFQIVSSEAQTFIDKNAPGFEALGVQRDRALTFGLAARTEDVNGNELTPPFSRRQMTGADNFEDWDT